MKYLLTAFSLLISCLAQAQDVTALLKAADRFRTSSDNVEIHTQIQVYKADGTLDKDRQYTVFAQANHQSLVLMQSPAEKGQKVLMLRDDFWLLMPASQRPMRITPTQKLLGDASTGDIATLSWSQDYSGQVVGEERCGEVTCQHLSLQANRKGVSYQRIELWLGKVKHEPLRAQLFVQSDKLAKEARFVLDKTGREVSEMILLDSLSNHKETRVKYLSRKDRTVPESWLNPMFLARNPALE